MMIYQNTDLHVEINVCVAIGWEWNTANHEDAIGEIGSELKKTWISPFRTNRIEIFRQTLSQRNLKFISFFISQSTKMLIYQ